jgi:hypothetical protein
VTLGQGHIVALYEWNPNLMDSQTNVLSEGASRDSLRSPMQGWKRTGSASVQSEQVEVTQASYCPTPLFREPPLPTDRKPCPALPIDVPSFGETEEAAEVRLRARRELLTRQTEMLLEEARREREVT